MRQITRNERVKQMALSGTSVIEIATTFSISRQRVYKILEALDIAAYTQSLRNMQRAANAKGDRLFARARSARTRARNDRKSFMRSYYPLYRNEWIAHRLFRMGQHLAPRSIQTVAYNLGLKKLRYRKQHPKARTWTSEAIMEVQANWERKTIDGILIALDELGFYTSRDDVKDKVAQEEQRVIAVESESGSSLPSWAHAAKHSPDNRVDKRGGGKSMPRKKTEKTRRLNRRRSPKHTFAHREKKVTV